jgi:hypothetical protein
VSAKLDGAYDCSAEVVNPDDTYDFNTYKYQPLRIVLDYASTTVGTFTGAIRKEPVNTAGTTVAPVTASCFTSSGEKQHGYGMIQSVDEGFEIVDGSASFKLMSFFARLSKLPVTSPPYNNLGTDTCDTAIDDLIRIFSQIPAWDALSDVGSQKRGGTPASGYGENGSNYIWTQMIQGDSIIDKLRLLAEANYCELFVDVTGRLIMEHWKDHRSAVEVILPHELIISVSTSRSVSVLPSRIKVQGRPMSVVDMCGRSPLNENKKKNPGSGGGRGGGAGNDTPQRGANTVCIKNGVANQHATLCQKIQKAGNNERNNAKVGLKDPKTYPNQTGTTYDYRTDDDPSSTGETTDDERPVEVDVTVATDDGFGGENYYMGGGDHEIEVTVFGTRQENKEWQGSTSRDKDAEIHTAENTQMVEDTADHLGGWGDSGKEYDREAAMGDYDGGQSGNLNGGKGGGKDGAFDVGGGVGKGGAMQGDTLNNPNQSGRGRSGGGSGGGGGKKKKDNNKNANEPEETRLECTTFDPDLQTEFGDTMETIDNPFIISKGQALEVAARRFQRIRMGSRVFSLSIIYSPCIDVNTVISFRLPLSTAVQPDYPLTDSPDGTYDVTGLVTSVSIDYDAAPSVMMSIEVEPFYTYRNDVLTDYIGTTEYAGCNEMDDLCGMEVS